MDALQQKVDHLIEKVDEMYATLYEPKTGIVVRQHETLTKVSWTKTLLIGVAKAIGYGLTTAIAVVTLLQMLHR